LAGIYIHGSLALHSFNPASSDIDVIVLVNDKIDLDTRYELIKELLRISLNPSPIEISFITRAAIEPWQHPTPFELHSSEYWRARYEERVAAGDKTFWAETPTDSDLACHLTLVRRYGIRIYGLPIDEAIPIVPEADFRSSILSDIGYSVNALHSNPVYGILTLCRVLSYLETREILSKREAGLWALRRIPDTLRYIVNNAVEAYDGTKAAVDEMNVDDLEHFGQLMSKMIASYKG
jgi:streptomycin 3"-adenylyltransferase